MTHHARWHVVHVGILAELVGLIVLLVSVLGLVGWSVLLLFSLSSLRLQNSLFGVTLIFGVGLGELIRLAGRGLLIAAPTSNKAPLWAGLSLGINLLLWLSLPIAIFVESRLLYIVAFLPTVAFMLHVMSLRAICDRLRMREESEFFGSLTIFLGGLLFVQALAQVWVSVRFLLVPQRIRSLPNWFRWTLSILSLALGLTISVMGIIFTVKYVIALISLRSEVARRLQHSA